MNHGHDVPPLDFRQAVLILPACWSTSDNALILLLYVFIDTLSGRGNLNSNEFEVAVSYNFIGVAATHAITEYMKGFEELIIC